MAQKRGGRIWFFGPKGKNEKKPQFSRSKNGHFYDLRTPPRENFRIFAKGGGTPPFLAKKGPKWPILSPFWSKGGGTPPLWTLFGVQNGLFWPFLAQKGGVFGPPPGPIFPCFPAKQGRKRVQNGGRRIWFFGPKCQNEKKPQFSRRENGHFFGLGTPPRENFRIFAKGGGTPPFLTQKGPKMTHFGPLLGQKGGYPPFWTQKGPKMTHFGPFWVQRGGYPPFWTLFGVQKGGGTPPFLGGGVPPLRTLFWVQKRGYPYAKTKAKTPQQKYVIFVGVGAQLTLRTIS